jgi:phenylacetate-CoA ligase
MPSADMTFPTRAAIEASQLEQLRSLLAEILPANRFYSQKLQASGVGFDVASLGDFCARFPFTTKSEVVADQRAHPPFGTNLTYPLERYTRYHQTSGTTSSPLRWLDTPESWDWMVESWMEVHRAAGVHAGDRVYFAFSYGPFIGFWLAFESATRLGCLCVPGGGLSSAARLRAMVDNGITVLCCTPTYAIRLAEVAAEERIDLNRAQLLRLMVAGEPGGSIPAVRARLSELWPGARISDHHGMTEVGPVTYECPARPGVLHVLDSAYLTEIVEPPTGNPVSAGQAGELVLTPLGRAGSPLLRYRTGDLVRKSEGRRTKDEPCACGRFDLALEGGILGRVDDMVIVRGVNVFPSAMEELVVGCGGVAEYRVRIQNAGAMAELSIEIEPRPDCGNVSALARKLEHSIATSLALRVPVTTVPPGTLARFEMKAKRWIKETPSSKG